MGHAAEGRDRNTAIYLIGSQVKRLIADHGVRDAKFTCSSVTLHGDLRITLWDTDEWGAQMFAVYDGAHTVLSGHLNHAQPQGSAKNYYAPAKVLIQTWNRGTWQRRLFEEAVDTPKSPPKQIGLRLVHSREE